MAVYLEAGSRQPDDMTTCSDIDMKSANADGRFVHKNGSPYSSERRAELVEQDAGAVFARAGVVIAVEERALLGHDQLGALARL